MRHGTNCKGLTPASTILSVIAKALFWGSLGALAWTQVGYPVTAAALARLRGRPVRRDESTPSVSLIVAAHNEDGVIDRRLENLLALDYPPEQLEIVVASDASTDRTNELVEAVAAHEPRVRLLRCPRGGKVAAQNQAVRETRGEILAFSDANAQWKPDALRKLVRQLRRSRGCVRVRRSLLRSRGRNQPRGHLLALRSVAAHEASPPLGSITGGIGAIYSVRRSTTSTSTLASATTSRCRT